MNILLLDHEENSPTDSFSQEAIRKALRAWDSTRLLGEHPLAQIKIVQERRQAAGYSDSTAGHGLALRETLMAAIEALCPDKSQPNPADRRWRPYLILNEQYIREKSRECVIADLHISRRTYYNEQDLGMQAVGNLLSEWEALATRQPISPVTSGVLPSGENYVPFLAPPCPTHKLIGRESLLHDLKSRLLESASSPNIALQGLPGVGKTSLAVHLAHDADIRARYQDGILWAGLGRQPDTPAILANWGMALHIPPDAIARCTSSREYAQAIHTAISTRRILLVIDDAWQSEDALAFRLGGPNCACLLTTRLLNVALDFADDGLITAHELDSEQGVHLMAEFAPQAIATKPDEARALADAVGGLPLALVLMGRHLRQHSLGGSTRRLQIALQQLQENQARLQLSQPVSLIEQRTDLPDGAPLSLQTIISLSEAALDEASRQALHHLAIFPPKPNTFSEEAALAVIDAPIDVLDTLLAHGLIECASENRYTLHQTIADYARLQGDCPKAQQRFVAHFTTLTRDRQSLQELDMNNQLHTLDLAYQIGMFSELFDNLHALQASLARRGLHATAEQHLQRAVSAARSKQDAISLAWMLCYLGFMIMRQSRFREAEGPLRESIALAEHIKLPQVQAQCLQSLGEVYFHLNDCPTSNQFHAQAVALFEQIGDMQSTSKALVGLGRALLNQEKFEEADTVYQRAISICQQIGDKEGAALALNGLGLLTWELGDCTTAQRYFEQSYQAAHQADNLRLEAGALHNMGTLYDDLCDYTQARNCLQKSLNALRNLHDRRNEGRCLSNLGLFSHHLGDQEAAREYSLQAKNIAAAIGDHANMAHALTYLGLALEKLGEAEPASIAYQEALCAWDKIREEDQAPDAVAGLGRVYLAQGNLTAARTQVATLLAYEEKRHDFDMMDEPQRVYITCYQILLTTGEKTLAHQLIKRAHQLLLKRANQIVEPNKRQFFLENGPAHQEVLLEYQKVFEEESGA